MAPFTAGCGAFQVPDPPTGDLIDTLVLYPAHAPEVAGPLGPYVIELARDAAPAPGPFPLAVISHGSGGTPFVYRTLARHLARHGYVVALPEHPRNNRNHNELAGTAAILANRPRHVRLVIDRVLSHDVLGPVSATPPTVAVIGHSLGGYTALALAGGLPTAYPNETPSGRSEPVAVAADPRVTALVLLAPATPWFAAPGALAAVRLPILMITAGQDPHTPPWQAAIVASGVSADCPLTHRVIPGAGHFSFLDPFPPAMTSPSFPPSQDPPGFDRCQFHEQLHAGVLAFLKATDLGANAGTGR